MSTNLLIIKFLKDIYITPTNFATSKFLNTKNSFYNYSVNATVKLSSNISFLLNKL